MSAKIKVILYSIVSLGGNVALLAGILPSPYKELCLAIFNLVQVAYAFYDPTFVIQKLGMTKLEFLGRINNPK